MNPKRAQKLLRRLAPRSVRVLERHSNKEPGLAAFISSLGVSAPTFIEGYDEVQDYASFDFYERRQGKQAVSSVIRKIRIWGPQVARDLDNVSVRDYGDNPAVADDVIKDAKLLIDRVSSYTDADGQPLPYADALVADLTAALEAAQAEWKGAEVTADEMAARRSKVRELAAVFEQDLKAFRKALLAVIGRSHPDYQKLRASKARNVDEDDDANAPSAAELDLEPDPADDDDLEAIEKAGEEAAE